MASFFPASFLHLTTFQTNQPRKTSLRTFQKIIGKKKTSREEKQEEGEDTRPQSYSASHNASYNPSHNMGETRSSYNMGETRSSNVLQRQKRSRSTDPVRARFSRSKWEVSYYKGIELDLWLWVMWRERGKTEERLSKKRGWMWESCGKGGEGELESIYCTDCTTHVP